MVKVVTFLKSRPDMARPEFQYRWLTIHAPLAAQFINLRGYVLATAVSDDDTSADAVAELWFDSRDAAQASYATELGRRGSADANAYTSRREHIYFVDEERMAAPLRTSHKLTVAAKRSAQSSREEFFAWWREDFASALGSIAGVERFQLCFDDGGTVLNSSAGAGTLAPVQTEAVFDTMAQVWFRSQTVLLAATAGIEPLLRPARERTEKLEVLRLEDHVIL